MAGAINGRRLTLRTLLWRFGMGAGLVAAGLLSGQQSAGAAAADSYPVPVFLSYTSFPLVPRVAVPPVSISFEKVYDNCIESWKLSRRTYSGEHAGFDRIGEINISTRSGCQKPNSNISFTVTVNHRHSSERYGEVRFTLTQAGPRIFSTTCTDEGSIHTGCSSVGGPFLPIAHLNVQNAEHARA